MKITVPKWLADLIERAGWTALQAALAIGLAAGAIDATTLQVIAVGAVAAFLSVIKTAVSDWLRTGKRSSNLWVDLGERAGFTFLEVFLAAIIVDPGSPAMWNYALVSGFAAALALVKGRLAANFGRPSPATLPIRLDPTPWPWADTEDE